MQRKNSGSEEGGGDSWLNTYADMVTLLLTFFAVLLSMSSVNQEKYNAFIRSFSNLPPEVIEEITNPAVEEGEDPATVTEEQAAQAAQAAQAMSELYEKLSDYVESNGMSQTVSITKVDQVISIKFDSSVFFEPDKYVMRAGGKDTIAFVGDGIKEYEDMIKLVAICGHTATVPDNSNSNISDWMLSGERAAVTAMFFEDEKNIDPQKIILLGYGKNLPVATNDTEEGRMANRRVEIVVIGLESDISFDPYSDLNSLNSLTGDDESTSPGQDTNSPQESTNPDVEYNVSPYD